jgi:hypothetical protein
MFDVETHMVSRFVCVIDPVFGFKKKAESNSVYYVQIGEITMCVDENTMLQLTTQVSS